MGWRWRKRKERRRYRRTDVRWMARCTFDGDPHGLLCRVIDVSIRGAAVVLPDAFHGDTGRSLTVDLYVGEASTGFQLRGVVTHTRPVGTDTITGIEFTDVSEYQERLLALLIGLDAS